MAFNGTVKAQQADGYDDVVLKDDRGQHVAKVPNGDIMTVLENRGETVKVRWNNIDGWAKARNLKEGLEPPKKKLRGNKAPFFICHTKSSKRWACASFAQSQIWQPLRRMGFDAFFDVEALEGETIETCEVAAGGCGVLIVVLDDMMPTGWCIREMTAAMKHKVPIQTVMDTTKFRWEEVGKDTWRHKQFEGRPIDPDLIQYVFRIGTLNYNSHPSFVEESERKLLNALLNHLPNDRLPAPREKRHSPACDANAGNRLAVERPRPSSERPNPASRRRQSNDATIQNFVKMGIHILSNEGFKELSKHCGSNNSRKRKR